MRELNCKRVATLSYGVVWCGVVWRVVWQGKSLPSDAIAHVWMPTAKVNDPTVRYDTTTRFRLSISFAASPHSLSMSVSPLLHLRLCPT